MQNRIQESGKIIKYNIKVGEFNQETLVWILKAHLGNKADYNLKAANGFLKEQVERFIN